MFHLQSGIHFEKVKIPVFIDNKLHRPCRLIIDGFGQGDGLFAHFLPGGFINERARGFFNDFLVAALDRTFPLTQINHIAVAVAQYLNFNMSRLFNVFFNEDSVITKA